MRTNAKGLIYAFGNLSSASAPADHAKIVEISVALSLMIATGIKQVLIASTAVDIPLFRQALNNYPELGLDVSYLLMDDDADVVETIAAANEFVAQSTLFVTTPSAFCVDERLAAILKKSFDYCKGVTSIKLKIIAPKKDLIAPELFICSVRSRKLIQSAFNNARLSGTFRDLERYCSENLKFDLIEFESQYDSLGLAKGRITEESTSINEIIEAMTASRSRSI